MKEDSLKWQKHLKLVEYDLRKYEDLISEIHRYKISAFLSLYNDIMIELINDLSKQLNAFYIIKLVKNEQYFKLPNYRIFCISDLEKFLGFINSRQSMYDELWYCRTQYDETSKMISVAGRISFDKEVGGNLQTIEQIWNRSPRMIEEYNLYADFIYVRASRLTWGHRYHFNKLHIPDTYKIEDKDIAVQFSNSIIEIERLRDKLEIFEEYLSSFNYKAFTLEYKILNGSVSFIDWDTPNDMLVLRK